MVSASKAPAPAGDPLVVTSGLQCPVPVSERPEITMGHGGGGRLTEDLLDHVFRPAFSNPALDTRHDGALLRAGGARLAFTTDSHVVSPLFFPGGDIGTVAVNGTVNDLAMCGACPLWLSAGFILEEGLPIAVLRRVVASMKAAADAAGVSIVTGDTKVVERGKGDGLYVTTAGVGLVREGVSVGPARIEPGDVVILSGDIGRHGMAVMSVREGMAFEGPIESDCAPLAAPVAALLDDYVEVHCMRDLTRGGLATALIELAETRGLEISVDERSIPVTRGGARRLRDPRARPALCRQRGALHLLRPGVRSPLGARGPRPLGARGAARGHRAGARLDVRGGHASQDGRGRAGPLPAERRAAAQNLLGSGDSRKENPKENTEQDEYEASKDGSVGRQRHLHAGRVGALVGSCARSR